VRRRELLASSLAAGPLALAACGPRSVATAAPSASAGEPTASGPSPPPVEPFAALAGFCDGVPAVEPGELAERRERARAHARDRGLAGVVLEAGPDLAYLTGLRWNQSERPLLWLLPVEGDPAFVGPAFETGTLREQIGDGELHAWDEHENPYDRLAELLGARKLARRRIAVGAETRLFVFDGLRRAASMARLEPGGEVLAACRIVKTARELARLRRASEATKVALKAAAAHVEPGMNESEVAALVRRAQEAAGLSGVWVLALAGPNAAFPHGTRHERVIEAGDLVLVDTGGSLHGYWSDVTRTFAVGPPTDAQRRAFDTVLAAQSAALAAVRPGARCEDLDAAARAVMASAGLGGGYERFTHRLGHGIGLQVHEAPYLVRGNPLALAPGMTFSDEPGLYEPGRLGVRLEDIVAVTEGGAEVFGPRAHSLDVPFGEG
jgi:Xaa-Pro dipeptidase